MLSRPALIVGWLAVTTIATTIGMATVSVVRGVVGEPSTVVTLSSGEISTGLIDASQRTAPPSLRPSTTPTPSASSSKGPAGPTKSASPRPTASANSSSGPFIAPKPPKPPAPSPSSSTAPVYRSLPSAGGTILARCTGSTIYVVSASPNQGYRVNIHRRDGEEAEVAFSGDHDETVHLSCVGGVPSQVVETDS